MALFVKLRFAAAAKSLAPLSVGLVLAACVPAARPALVDSDAGRVPQAENVGRPVPVVQNLETPTADAANVKSASAEPAAETSVAGSNQNASRGHDPKELVGLSGDQVTGILGKPSFVRRDAPAEIWQYRSRDCVLDIFLYPPAKAKENAEHTVVYYELRGKKAEAISGDSCYSALISANRSS